MAQCFILSLPRLDRPEIMHGGNIEEAAQFNDRSTESLVLARAGKWHAEHRVLIDGKYTVVFR